MNNLSHSVSKILFYYFNLYPENNIQITQKNYLGLFIHKILFLYYKYNKNFNILIFLNSKKEIINIEEKNKIIFIVEKLKEILKKKKLKILFYEKDFIYNNLYGRPDAIFLYNYNFSLNYYSSLFLKYFYSIKSNCINKNLFLNSFKDPIYDKQKNNIILIDWKCSTRNIFFSNYTSCNHYLKKFLYNTLYNKCLIQMNIYKYILEKNEYNVMEMYICLLNIENYSVEFIPIYFLKEEFIEKIINKYKNQNI